MTTIRPKKTFAVIMTITLLAMLAIFQTTNSQVNTSPYDPPREKTLKIPFSTKLKDPDNWNPFVPGYTTCYATGLLWGPYEYLIYTNWNTGETVPWLATNITYSADFLKLNISIRNDVKWWDGKNLTADDVVFTFQMMLDVAPRLTFSPDVAANIESIEKIDEYTIEMTLLSPNPRHHLLHWAFSNPKIVWSIPIVPKHIWQDIADPLAFKNNPPRGSGPYELVESSEIRVLWQRRDDWWGYEAFGVRAAPEYIELIYAATDDVLMMRFGKDELDCSAMYKAMHFTTTQEMNPYVTSWYENPPYVGPSGVCPRYLMFNNVIYPWSLKEVRWAVSYAINRTKVIYAQLGGAYGTAEPSVISPLMMNPDYREILLEVSETYDATEYNPTKSVEILEGIGFTLGGDGIWVTPNGTRLDVEIVTSVNREEALTSIAEDLQAIGIDATWKTVEGPVNVDTVCRGNYEIAMRHMCASTIDPFFALDNMHSRHYMPIGEKTGWHINIERFNNSTFDDIIDEMRATSPDDPACLELYRQAITIYLQELPATTLYDEPEGQIYNTKLWIGWPGEDTPLAFQSPTHGGEYMRTVIGYSSLETGEWVGGIRPRTIETTTVCFTQDVSTFRGIDLIWYGPFTSGDSAIIPVGDAEFLIGREVASLGLGAIAGEVTEIRENMDTLVSEVQSLTGQIGTLTMGIAALGIGIVVLAMALVLLIRKI